MLRVRVIPTLLLRNAGLVKGSRFKNHKYVGDPVNAVKIFNDKLVDELVFLDIAATASNNEPNYSLLADIASQAFMPFGYGGGIRSTAHIEKLFRIGVEKVLINTAAVEVRHLISEASSIAGSQSVVVSMDVKRNVVGGYHMYTRGGTRKMTIDPVDFARQMEDAGAGEILLTAIDREGTGKGFDLDIIHDVATAVSIPVVASGGAGSLEDFRRAVAVGASAVAAGDMFTFRGKHKAVLITYPPYGRLEQLLNEVLE